MFFRIFIFLFAIHFLSLTIHYIPENINLAIIDDDDNDSFSGLALKKVLIVKNLLKESKQDVDSKEFELNEESNLYVNRFPSISFVCYYVASSVPVLLNNTNLQLHVSEINPPPPKA